MQRHWSEQELDTYWSFSSDELTLIPQRDASSRLGVAASLKFFQLEGSFPLSVTDIPAVALAHMAKLLHVDPKAILDYDWQGRTGTRYRGRLRTALGVRPATAEDFQAVESWLCKDVVPWDHHLRHLQDAVLGWYRSRHIEPPTEGRIERLARSAVRTHEAEVCHRTVAQLLPHTRQALDALMALREGTCDKTPFEIWCFPFCIRNWHFVTKIACTSCLLASEDGKTAGSYQRLSTL